MMKTISLIHNIIKNSIKLLSVVLILVCVFSLTACKDKNQQNQNTNGVEQTTSAPTPTPTGIHIDDEDDFLSTPAATGDLTGTNSPSAMGQTNVTPVLDATPTPTLAPVQTPVSTPVPTASPTFPGSGVQLPFDPFD